MEIAFNAEDITKIEQIKSKYPDAKAALMPVLWLSQRKFGSVSPEVQSLVADTLQIPKADVEGVAGFYTMYFKKPVGKYHVQVCTNVSCMICGGKEIYDKISSKLGIKHNETTADGLFSLEEVECMGACGGAPMIAINEDFYENVDINKLDEMLDKFSRE